MNILQRPFSEGTGGPFKPSFGLSGAVPLGPRVPRPSFAWAEIWHRAVRVPLKVRTDRCPRFILTAQSRHVMTPVKQWMVETNERYSSVVATVISLATGSLVLPVFFLREFLGVPKEKALLPFLNVWAYLGWGCLGGSILLGVIYSWLSVKWVKSAWGEKTCLSEGNLECFMDVSGAKRSVG
jgi:hypothetical protein